MSTPRNEPQHSHRILVTAPILALLFSAFVFFWLSPARVQAIGASRPAVESALAPPQTNPARAPARPRRQEGGDPVQIALAYIERQAKEWRLP